MKFTRARLTDAIFTSLAITALGAVAPAHGSQLAAAPLAQQQADVKTAPVDYGKTLQGPAKPVSSRHDPLPSKSDVAGVGLAGGRPDHSRMYYSDAGADVWARGETYKARFGDGSVELIPLFGAAAPRNYPLALELASVTIAGDALAFQATAAAERDRDRIVFHRGALDEVYDLAPRAVEQSFVFADLPARGALSLRVAYRGEFAPEAQGDGVRFAHELGAVMCSGAMVYDRDGNKLALDVTIDGDALAIDVPASFVANAALPLTVDPIFTVIGLDLSTADSVNADVAYDLYTDTWRVVYEEVLSQSDIDIYSSAFDATGLSVIGSGFYVDVSSVRWAHPRIANNFTLKRFIVVAEAGAIGSRQIMGVKIEAVTQAHSAPIVIADTVGGEKINPDIGGDTGNSVLTKFCVVYERVYNSTDHDIHVRMIDCTGVLSAGYALLVDNTSNTLDAKPSISKSNGAPPWQLQDWTIVWQREVTATDHDIFGARVHWDGTLTDATFPVANTAFDQTNPTVSSPLDVGVGPRPVMVACEFRISATDRDIELVRIAGHNFVNADNLSLFEGASALDQRTPAIASEGSQFAIAFAEQWIAGSADYDMYVSHVGIGGGVISITAPREHVGSSTFVDARPALCSAHSGGAQNSIYCAVWDVDVGGNSGHNILGALLDGPQGGGIEVYCDGNTVTCPCNVPGGPGYGCPNSVNGGGAHLGATGVASVANDSISFMVSGVPTTAACLFFQGQYAVTAPFGTGVKCAGGGITRLGLKIASASSAIYPAAGDASVAVKGLVPALGGARYYQVWYRDPANACANATYNMSNAIKITWLP